MRSIVCFLIITIFLLTGSVARSADIDPILPADTYQFMHIDVKQLAKTKFAKHTIDNSCVTVLGYFANVELEFNKELGINIIEDVDTITKVNGRDLIILRGRFNIEKLKASAKKAPENKEAKYSMAKEGDFEFILYGEGLAAQKYIALVSEKLIICGRDAKTVADCVTVARSKDAKPRISKELAEVIKKQDSKASVLFATTFIKGQHRYARESGIWLTVLFPHLKDDDKFDSIIADTQVASVTVKAGQELDIEIAVGAKYREAADMLTAELSKGLEEYKKSDEYKSFLKIMPKAFIEEFGRGLKPKAKDKYAVISFHFSAAVCDSLISLFDEQQLAEKKKAQDKPKDKDTLPDPSLPRPSK